MTTDSDELLVARFQAGDRAAFTALVRRHQGPLFHFAFRQLRSAPAAEDVVQEAFVRVVQSAAEFKNEARFTTWVYTITRNLCIDQLRKRAHRRHPSLDEARGDDGDRTLGEVVPDRGADVERDAVGAELQQQVAAAVELLPPDQKEVFLMREVAHLPFKEIAAITGVPENTVKSRMRYALERLQAALKDHEEYARALR
ncbi:MAG: RNA polymerase sigma factor [Myxococcales bacterium]|jgi:RNA polymerase sigma-70 factor (ECF subfamily)|nr:RNA polymerase sigma factor [Myxococcales bacterium]MBL0197828.1 RNA polymerase sigma factor [Myxococcales bacterium]HQY63529.1 RNA polymerase sigma factor [Polyangiaceae bacterium]